MRVKQNKIMKIKINSQSRKIAVSGAANVALKMFTATNGSQTAKPKTHTCGFEYFQFVFHHIVNSVPQLGLVFHFNEGLSVHVCKFFIGRFHLAGGALLQLQNKDEREVE